MGRAEHDFGSRLLEPRAQPCDFPRAKVCWRSQGRCFPGRTRACDSPRRSRQSILADASSDMNCAAQANAALQAMAVRTLSSLRNRSYWPSISQGNGCEVGSSRRLTGTRHTDAVSPLPATMRAEKRLRQVLGSGHASYVSARESSFCKPIGHGNRLAHGYYDIDLTACVAGLRSAAEVHIFAGQTPGSCGA